MRAPTPRSGGRARSRPRHVHLRLVHPEHPHRVERDRGERLVDLEQIHVLDAETGLVERVPGGVGGLRARYGKSSATAAWPTIMASAGLRGLRPLVAGETIAPAPSFTPGALPAVWVPSLWKAPFRPASDSSEVSRRGASSTSKEVSPFRDLTVTDTISSGRRPRRWPGRRARGSAARTFHVGARDLELVADLVGLLAHALAAERVGQPVGHHRVERLGIPHLEAEARALQPVGRFESIHAAGHGHLEVAGAHRLVHDAGGAQAGGADSCSRSRRRPPWGSRP